MSNVTDDGVFNIYRFFNTLTGTHFFTASDAERDNVIATLPHFNFEGNVFDSNAVAGSSTEVTPVFRFLNTETGVHFFTSSEAEKDNIIATLPQFSFEGVAYQAFNAPGTEREAVFRFFNTETGTHFYTSNEAEKDNIISTLPQFNFEDISYYVGGPLASKGGGEFNNEKGARDAIDQITDDNVEGAFTTSGEGDFGISTAQSGSVINIDTFRQTPQYRDIDGSGHAVVIIDTGIDLNHSFFGADTDGNGISDRIIYTQDFTNDGDGTANDVNGHGTNVASIAASSSSTYPGIVPGADIIALQVLGNTGQGSWPALEEALQWVVANAGRYNITAINMSLGDDNNYTNLQFSNGIVDELLALQSLGVISVAAAGNDYFNFQTSGVAFPAIIPSVIAVGATFDANVGNMRWQSGAEAFTSGIDEITPFSQRGVGLTDIFAPGALIEGATVGGNVAGLTGTSQASPHIAGIAVLAQQLAERELGRRLTTDEFVNLLQTTGDIIFDGDDEDDNVVNTNQSYQRVDVLAMADAIVALGGGSGGTTDIAGNLNTTAELSTGSSLSSDIGADGDTDWVKIWLNRGTKYTFDLKASSSGVGTLSDPWLGLYDPTGIFVTSDDDGGTDLEGSLNFTPTQTGYYYLSAESYGLTGTGTYILSASGDGASDDYSGGRTTSGVVAVGGSATGVINFSGDRDWFKVQLVAGQDYSFLLNGSGLSDPYLELYGPTGASVLAADDDTGAGNNSLLEFTAFSSGTYYLSARGYSTEVGGYTLQAAQQNTASVSDIVLRNINNGEIGVWDFTVGGTFTFHTIQDDLGLNWTPQLTANLVTRGNDDMILRDANTGTIGYWDFGDNGQRTWNVIQDNLDTLWQVQDAGDFTLDGRDDIILRNINTGEIGYWDFEPNGAINWISVQDDLGTNWLVQGVGDITNNGFDDIILRDMNTGAIGYWKFDANDAREWTVIQDDLGLNWQVNDVADITNDGHSDIILREVNTGAIGYWDFSDGGVSWSFIEIQNDLSLNWQVHGTGDFTGDQNEDIVLRDISTGGIGYWDFNAGGSFDWIEVQTDLGLNWQVQGTADIWGV